MKNNKGFSLVELLAVIVILSIILALSTTSVMKIKENQDKKNLVNVINSVLTSAKACETKENCVGQNGINVGALEKDGKVKYDKSKHGELDNKTVKYEMCENTLKRRFVLVYDANTKYNDLGCVDQLVLSSSDGDVTLVIGKEESNSNSSTEFAGWNGSGEYFSCKKNGEGTAFCTRDKSKDIIKKED